MSLKDAPRFIVKTGQVSIKSTYRRKSPPEEFFQLVSSKQTSQAVKMNSAYMDRICTLPMAELY